MKIEPMSAKYGSRDSKKGMYRVRTLLLLSVMITALFATAQTAQAAGTPAKLIVFTDKKIYSGWIYSTPQGGTTLTWEADFAADLKIIVYAIVLDDDGNIMTGRAGSLTGRANETQKLSPGGGSGHHTITNSPNVFGNFTLMFVDNGSVPGDVSGDGIYVAIANMTDPAGTLTAEHYKYNISVSDPTAGTQYAEVLISGLTCMQSGKLDHNDASAHISDSGSASSRGSDNCAVCHHGYEHMYENISGTFRNDQLDIHKSKVNGIDVTNGNAQKKVFNNYRWNYSDSGGSTTDNWEAQVPGSKFCAQCHIRFTDSTYAEIADGGIFDYGDAARTNSSDIPSCDDSTCHKSGKTTFENTSIPAWEPSAMGPVKEGSNENITKSKSHNHTSTSPARVACSLCHYTTHAYNLPNTTANITSKPINEQCWLCHNTTGGLNITSNSGSNIDHSNNDCKSCHSNDADRLDPHIVPTAGGPDCISCHDYGKTSSQRINNSAMNSSNVSHARLNNNSRNSSDVSAENKKCWGCHTSNGSQPGNTSMGNRYNNPYKCYDCHNSTGKPYANASTGLNVSEHFKGGDQIRAAATAADNSSSCTVCHNLSELKVGYNEDDSYNTAYSLSSHYARNRTDLRTWNSSRAVNCSYCHQNSSTAFAVAMIDPAYNRSIQDHSASLSPVCFNSTCHGSGWIHNSTLTKPALSLPNSTYCQLCHPTKQKHDGTQDCTLCHINTSSNDTIHPIKYLQTNGSFITSNSSAVNCTNCHLGAGFANFSSAPIIPSPLKHSSNISNGTTWGTYWTTGNGSCYYCHSNTKHNSTAFGNINALLNSYNVRNGSLTTTQWCADCHYNDSLNTDFKGSLWNPAPPYISYDNTQKSGWMDHSDYLSGGYNDSDCRNCHALNGSYTATSLNYSHSLDPGAGGGPDCITCHNLVTGLAGGAPVGINFTAANASSHNGMNSNNATSQGYTPITGACWACHDSDGNVMGGHPDRYKTPRKCDDCHLAGGSFYSQARNWGGLAVAEHYSNGTDIKAGNSTTNISSCINCHENVTEMILYNNDTDYGSFTGDGIRLNGGNLSFYHYGRNRTDIRTGNSANCSYCHRNTSTAFEAAMINSSYNRSIGNHSNYSSNPGCTSCHNTGWIHNSTLTKPGLDMPNSTFCLNCHGKNSTSGLINFTGAITSIKEKHNNSVNCTECHMNTVKDVHPVKYLLQDATYSTLNTSSVTCITCHQAPGVDAVLTLSPPKVPVPMHHSDNAANGTIWNSTAYWTPTNPLTSCTYCHSDAKHNASALGRPAGWQGNNVVNSSPGTGTWCASCHYRNYSSGVKNYGDMTQAFTSANLSVPPEITNGSYAFKIYNRSSYYDHLLTDYGDEVCRLCHGINLSPGTKITSFMHNITSGSCTDCHYSFEAMNSTTRPDRYVDSAMYNTSLHRSLSCTNCHTQGHRNMGARKACEDCHAVQADPITDKDRHNITPSPGTYFVGASNVIGITDCATCHDSVLYNRSISTYGYWKPKDCDYCHTYPDRYYE